MRKLKHERKTIGKHYNIKIEQLESDLNDYTDNEHERSEFDSSFRDYWKNATADKKKVKHPIRIYDDYE